MSLRVYCQFCSAEVRNDSNICPTCDHALEDVAARRLEEGSGVQKKPDDNCSQEGPLAAPDSKEPG
jgi:hypothetical protein